MRAAGPRLAGRHRRADAVAPGPRTTRSRRRRDRRCRRRSPACRAATACRAARRRRRRRPGPGAGPRRYGASAAVPAGTGAVVAAPTDRPQRRPVSRSSTGARRGGSSKRRSARGKRRRHGPRGRSPPVHTLARTRAHPLVARTPEDLARLRARSRSASRPSTPSSMLTVGERPSFHARVDLPDDADDVDDVVDALLRPSLRAPGARRWSSWSTTTTPSWPTRPPGRCTRRSPTRGIEVIDVLRVHDDRWFAVLPGRAAGGLRRRPVRPGAGTPSRRGPSSTAGSPARAARSCGPPSTRVPAAVAEAAARSLADLAATADLRAQVRGTSCDRHRGLDPAELASVPVTLALGDPRPRRGLVLAVPRRWPAAHVELWSDACAGCPTTLVAGPAAVLAVRRLAGRGRGAGVVRGRPVPRGRARPLPRRPGGRPAGRRPRPPDLWAARAGRPRPRGGADPDAARRPAPSQRG